jgi:hypothetical protein
MHNRSHVVVFIAVALCAVVDSRRAISKEDGPEQSDIIVSRHPPWLVYFTDAPARIVFKLKRATNQYCSTRGVTEKVTVLESDMPHASRGICNGGKVRYIHGVNYRNESNGQGFTCLAELIEGDAVFRSDYNEYFHQRYRCLPFQLNTETRVYQLESPE